MKDKLFRLLFPEQYAIVRRSADLERRYRMMISSTQRSPLDESAWVRKFTALDADYAALVKENQDLEVSNEMLRRTVKVLVGL